jgi:DNA-binding GntR family transcriptional regulator
MRQVKVGSPSGADWKDTMARTTFGRANATTDTTLGAKIYERLAHQILMGKLPPGHRLDEQSLAVEFGVSRTPVREALRELGARQLIDLVPRRGGRNLSTEHRQADRYAGGRM